MVAKANSCLDLEVEVPSAFCCPLSRDIMNEPVVFGDGFSYELAYISEWALENETSPLTRERVSNKIMIPNLTLKNMIKEYREKNPNISKKQEASTNLADKS